MLDQVVPKLLEGEFICEATSPHCSALWQMKPFGPKSMPSLARSSAA
jgi:hypothetical protein